MMDIKTLTGLTMEQAATALNEKLEPAAYKVIPATNPPLTDIKPAWLTETLNRVFGLCGIGWWFEYRPEDLKVVASTTEHGKDLYYATLDRLEFYFIYVLDGVERTKSSPVLGSGGSDNRIVEYAVRGAITNAIGAAASKLGWQLRVYKDQLDAEHKPGPKPAGEAPKPKPIGEATKPPEELPWYAKALAYAHEHAEIWNTALDSTPAGKRAINALIKNHIGIGRWWSALPHLKNSIKLLTGYGSVEEIHWADFERVVRYKTGDLVKLGGTLSDIIWQPFMNEAEFVSLLNTLNLPPDKAIDEDEQFAISSMLATISQFKTDGLLDWQAAAEFVKNSVKNSLKPY